MLGLRRLNTGEWNKPPVLTVVIATIMRQLGILYGEDKLKDAAVIHNGQGLKKADRDEIGEYAVYAAGGRVGNHSERLTEEPFVVIGRKGSAGKPTYAPDGGWVIDTAYYAQPRRDNLSCKFLYYALEACDFSQDVIATAIPGINRTAIYKHKIPLPPQNIQVTCTEFLDALAEGNELPQLPNVLYEQQRIVAKIDELAAKIEEAHRLRQMTLEEVMALVASRRAQLMNQARKFEEQVFDKAVGQIRGSSGLPLKEYQSTGRYPVIDQGQKFIAGYCDDERRLLHLPEEVVVWGDHTTNVKLIDFNFVPGADGTKVFVPKEGISAPFLFHFLKSVNFPDLGYSRHYRYLKQVLIPVPQSAEQRRIVAELDALQAKAEGLKQLQAQTAAEIDALLPSILDKAFKGEL